MIKKKKNFILKRQSTFKADFFIRRRAKHIEYEKKFIRFLIKKKFIVMPNKDRYYRSHSLNSIHTTCVVSDRNRGVKSRVKLSRHCTRSLGVNGYILGFKKRSW